MAVMGPIHRRFARLLLPVAIFAAPAFAQVEVGCRLKHNKVVQYEPVTVEVSVANRTGQPIVLAGPEADARMVFDIMRQNRDILVDPDHPLVAAPAVAEPGKVFKAALDAGAGYDLRAIGTYTLRARVDWTGRSFESPPQYLEVLPGQELMRIRGGGYGLNRTIFTYGLRTINRGGMDTLYLRIDSEDGSVCHGVFDLGSLLRLSPPVMKFDNYGAVHILHHAAPSQYRHTEFTGAGTLVRQTTCIPNAGLVTLIEKPDGRVEVQGAIPQGSDARPRRGAMATMAPFE